MTPLAASDAAAQGADSVALYRRMAAADSSGPEAPLALLRLTHPAPDSARLLLQAALWHGMRAMEHLEAALSVAASGGLRPALAADSGLRLLEERRDRIRAALVEALDLAVAGGTPEQADLEQLRLAWPSSPLLQRYVVELAERRGDLDGALAAADRLLRSAPADLELQRTRGRLLERAGRPEEAMAAYGRALDLAPEDEGTFRALQRLAEAQGRLPQLLAQLQRLRILLPDSPVLADHETEVTERLGQRGGRP
jgi:tetratricopeptide (TPR) repeat protein